MSGGRQYQLLRELGTGTFGTVYHAEMQAPGDFRKEVALKVLHPTWERHPDAASRFRDEARLLGQLRHRHVVKVDGLVRIGGRWAVVMEYVEGVDANLLVKACRKLQEPWPVPATFEVGAAVASALHAAFHFQPAGATEPLRVIHRDIKPSNIRLAPDGDVKVLDFGIAQADFEGREALTQSLRYGSIRYMSPERRKARPDSPAGDIYALGCVLLELILGRPFGNAEGRFAEHTEKVHQAMQRVVARVGEHAPPMTALLERMLHFDEAKRPAAAEVEEVCRHLARVTPGEDQTAFARRMVPRVPEILGEEVIEVGRWVSDTGGPSGSVPRVSAGAFGRRLWRHPTARVGVPALAGTALASLILLAQLLGAPAFDRTAPVATERVLMASALSAPIPEGLRAISPLQVRVPGASEVVVRCVGQTVAADGPRVTLQEAFAGVCAVRARIGGEEVATEVEVAAPGDLVCHAVRGLLSCAPDPGGR